MNLKKMKINVQPRNTSNILTIAISGFFPLRKQPPEVFCKKRYFRNFAKLTAKHLCQSLKSRKKRLLHSCFPLSFFPLPTRQTRTCSSITLKAHGH